MWPRTEAFYRFLGQTKSLRPEPNGSVTRSVARALFTYPPCEHVLPASLIRQFVALEHASPSSSSHRLPISNVYSFASSFSTHPSLIFPAGPNKSICAVVEWKPTHFIIYWYNTNVNTFRLNTFRIFPLYSTVERKYFFHNTCINKWLPNVVDLGARIEEDGPLRPMVHFRCLRPPPPRSRLGIFPRSASLIFRAFYIVCSSFIKSALFKLCVMKFNDW